MRLIRPEGSAFEVCVNSECTGFLGWQPWEVDVTDFLHNGINRFAITVFGSLRNTFGPLHNSDVGRIRHAVGPTEFANAANWSDTYRFEPYGLIGGAQLIGRRPARANRKAHERECP